MKTVIFFLALIVAIFAVNALVVIITNAIAFKRENKNMSFVYVMYLIDCILWTIFYAL